MAPHGIGFRERARCQKIKISYMEYGRGENSLYVAPLAVWELELCCRNSRTTGYAPGKNAAAKKCALERIISVITAAAKAGGLARRV